MQRHDLRNLTGPILLLIAGLLDGFAALRAIVARPERLQCLATNRLDGRGKVPLRHSATARTRERKARGCQRVVDFELDGGVVAKQQAADAVVCQKSAERKHAQFHRLRRA